MKKQKPKKGDKVKPNPYQGMWMSDNSIIPDYGTILSGKKDQYFVDFGTDDHATETVLLSDLEMLSPGVWLDLYMDCKEHKRVFNNE